MKKFSGILLFCLIFLPAVTFAACETDGNTVVYINGILTSKRDAHDDMYLLKTKFEKEVSRTDVQFINGYNPSHIGGAGDLIESASQLFGSPINNYDFNSILFQIYPEIATRKIFLVGHSQGTFYTNELYAYLLAHGEPKDSLGVYNIATPASFVAGSAPLAVKSSYLTSANDKVINAVRGIALKLHGPQPLAANISIPLTAQEAADPYGGHSLSGVYLAVAATRIVSSIESGLEKLFVSDATPSTSSRQDGCFIPPPRSYGYYAQKGFFFAADPMANAIAVGTTSAVAAGKAAYNAAMDAAEVAAGAAVRAAEAAYAMAAKWFSFGGAHPNLAAIGNSLGNSGSADTSAAPRTRADGNRNFSGQEAVAAKAGKNNPAAIIPGSETGSAPDMGARPNAGAPPDAGAPPGAGAESPAPRSESDNGESGASDSRGGGSGPSTDSIPSTAAGQAGSSQADFPVSRSSGGQTETEIVRDVALTSPSSTGSGASQGSAGASSTVSSTPELANATSSGGDANSTQNEASTSVASSISPAATSTSPEISTSTASSSQGSAPRILISEILFNASGTDAGRQFIELHNPTDAARDLAGWSLRYRKGDAASTTSLASFKYASHQDDKTLIPARGFLLVGLNNYDAANYGGRTPDILRSAALPEGESGGAAETITVIFSDASSTEIDRISYDKNSIAHEGQSIERKALVNSICASPQGANEFLGNGCDTDGASDFVTRDMPNPQSSASLPEPRNAPTISDFGATYGFAPQFNFFWGVSANAAVSSTLSYFIYDTSASSTLIFEATATSATPATITASTTYSINEVGRNYDFEFRVEDRDGLGSSATSTIAAKSFLDAFSFYPDTRPGHNGYVFDITTASSRPFWDADPANTAAGWKAIVFYLNKDAPKQSELSTDNQLVPSDGSYIRLSYDGCAGGSGNSSELIFPLDDASCIPGPLSAGAYNFRKLEDARFTVSLASSTADLSLSPDDYATLAFYDFGGGGGGSQRLRLAAVDKAKYHFQSAPAAQFAPTTPGNFSAAFNAANGKLDLSWTNSTDADTRDALIAYELNVSTSSALEDASWNPIGASVFSTPIIPAYPSSYTVGIRAKDDWGNASAPATLAWSFPDGFALLPSQSDHGVVIGTSDSGQQVLIAHSAAITGIAFFTEPDGGSFNNSQSYIEVRKDNGGRPNGEVVATSSIKTIGQYDGPGERIYPFPAPVGLEANARYWFIPSQGPSETTNGTRIYGSFSDPYPDGFWWSRPGADAYFRLIQ